MKFRPFNRVLLAACAALMAWSANAVSVAYNFTGTVDLVWGGSFYGITPAVGDPVVGTFSYNTSVPVQVIGPNVRNYPQVLPYRLSFTLGGVTIESDNGYSASLQTNSYYSLQMFDNDGQAKINGTLQDCDGIQLNLDNMISFSSAGLPSTSLPTAFSLANFTDTFGDVAAPLNISGATFVLNRLSPVPEPGIFTLFGSALFARMLRSFKQKCRIEPAWQVPN